VRGGGCLHRGAAESAVQAAINFSRCATRGILLVRSGTLETTMSQYLVQRILASPVIEVRYRCEIMAAHGGGHLESLELADRDTG
jgi:thioredoxin reductase (NADPH)